MSLERGGRADKYGNTYENRFLAHLMLQLAKEDLSAIIVEPLGVSGDAVEYIAEDKDGTIRHYQCKASNLDHNAWTVADLNRYSVLTRARDIIIENPKHEYHFISPLPYSGLDELCKRARTNSSADDFLTYQLSKGNSSAKLRQTSEAAAQTLGYSVTLPSGISNFIHILSHCHFDLIPDNHTTVQMLDGLISLVFTGNPASIRNLLAQYANDTGSYGRRITSKDIVDYLDAHNHHMRCYAGSASVLKKVDTLNTCQWDQFQPINGLLYHRSAADQVIGCLQHNESIILHGKAGSGKSGCLEEVIQYLKRQHILYLSLKLDKSIEGNSADAYGMSLGLPESPVHTLISLAAGNPCVLILDQLDALRWTSVHSSGALGICKEMIRQMTAANTEEKSQLSIIFSSRTFDLENDSGLRSLFQPELDYEKNIWTKIPVDEFTEKEVEDIVGDAYASLSPRLKQILRVPSALYVWSKLDSVQKSNTITSVHSLLEKWWGQLCAQMATFAITSDDLRRFKDKLVHSMEKQAVFSLPTFLFTDQTSILQHLASNGLLRLNSSANTVSFVHQSFLDYFLSAELLASTYAGTSLSTLLGDPDDQTPFVRYRLLTVLQYLLDSSISLFLRESEAILCSENIRYYFKCTVFEIASQCSHPSTSMLQFIDRYRTHPGWSDFVIQTVFMGHSQYVSSLPDFNWISDLGIQLLRSVNRESPDFVVDRLRPLAFRQEEQDQKIFMTLCSDPSDDSESMFQFRLRLLSFRPELLSHIYFLVDVMQKSPVRALTLIKLAVECLSTPSLRRLHTHLLYLGHSNDIQSFALANYRTTIDVLWAPICTASDSYRPHWPDQLFRYPSSEWANQRYEETDSRKFVNLLIYALQEFARREPQNLMQFVQEQSTRNLSGIAHEAMMCALCCLPEEFADQVFNWILQDFDGRIFVFSSGHESYLFETKSLLERFSSHCSLSLLQEMEARITYWHESPSSMCSVFSDRYEVQRSYHTPVYYAYWGHLQKELLPCLAYNRISTHTRSLIQVLNRNEWIHLPHFYCGFSSGPAKSVVSPVDRYVDRLSDQRWLEIISTPADKMNGHWSSRLDGEYYIDVTHESFSSSIGTAAQHDPARFARLALCLPANCYSGYPYHILMALADKGHSSPADTLLTSAVIRKYAGTEHISIIRAIIHILHDRADEDWPKDILFLLHRLIWSPSGLGKEWADICVTEEDSVHSINFLLQNSVNSIRGCALYAVEALLWAHTEYVDYFKPLIQHACHDSSNVVRFTTAACLLPIYNSDKQFSVQMLQELLTLDLRVIGSDSFWQIFSREYLHCQAAICPRLVAAGSSGISDLSEKAATFLCATAIYWDNKVALDAIEPSALSQKQLEAVCHQAIFSYDDPDYHTRSEAILKGLLPFSETEISSFSRLFYDKRINGVRDASFLVELIGSPQGKYLIHDFLRYAIEFDEEQFMCCMPLLLPNVAHILNDCDTWENTFILEDFIKCVVRLFDLGQDDLSIKSICLDLWDSLFRLNFDRMRPISDMIEQFS